MTTPLFQEALIEAQKLREAATAEAQNAVLKAVSPLIKKMIDQEISGVILEQQDDTVTVDPAQAASADMPPPAPAAPSPDAGSVAPLDATVQPPVSSDPSAPAVSAAAPPIVAPAASQVLGKIETGPTGEQQIVIPVDSLFQSTAAPAVTDTTAAAPPLPTDPAGAAPPPAATDPMAAAPAVPGAPPAEEPSSITAPTGLAEIYSAVDKFLGEQAQQAPGLPVVAPAPVPVQPTAQPAIAAAPAPAAAPAEPVAPAAPAPVAAVPNAAAAAPAPAVPQQPAMVMEYAEFKQKLVSLEEGASKAFKVDGPTASMLKDKLNSDVFSLLENLTKLRENGVVSPRLYALNESRLGLVYENLQIAYSYSRNPLSVKGKDMKKKTGSLKDFAKALFEGAEGFEKEVGKVTLPAEMSPSVTGDHAQKVSGNPDGVTAESEPVDFDHKADPGPQEKALMEQLEEEISSLMAEMSGDDDVELTAECGDMGGDDDVVLEMDEAELVAEARKAQKRLKAFRALREQEELAGGMEDMDAMGSVDGLGAGDGEMAPGDDSLSLTLDLDGVSGEDVDNVNVALDGDDLEVEMGEEGSEGAPVVPPASVGGAADAMDAGDDDMAGMSLAEVRKLVREQLEEMGMVEEEAPVEEEMVVENKMLRSQLDETRLLTARSIYLNKLFVRDDLSGAQKRKIVKYLDSARTLAEAKNVYNSIVKVLDGKGKKSAAAKPIQEGKQPMTETVASQPSVPSFDTSRWQVLAGMKKTAK